MDERLAERLAELERKCAQFDDEIGRLNGLMDDLRATVSVRDDAGFG